MTDRADLSHSIMLLLGGALLGVLGDLLFHEYPLGVNVSLYVVGFLAVAVALFFVLDMQIVRANALLALPALFFAAMFSMVSAPYLLVMNGFMCAVMLGLVVRYVSLPRFLFFQHWLKPPIDVLELAFVSWFEPFAVLSRAAEWTKTLKIKREHRLMAQAVGRGCAIALPIVAVFALLLSAADVVFSDLLGDMFALIKFGNLGTLIAHLTVSLVFAWIGTGLLKVALFGVQSAANVSESAYDFTEADADASLNEEVPRAGLLQDWLGLIEGGIVLGSVNALFLVFVLIQARYLFGGAANITRTGYTYSDYARRGFFELLAVSIVTMLLVLALDHTVKRSARQERVFRGLVLGVIVCALVILASAFQRMTLYENAYGFTRLRVVSHVFMVWLAVQFVVLVAHLFRLHPQVFWIGAAVVTCGFFASLNILNVDAFIAQRNIDRYRDTGKIDVYYLTTLSYDAVPAMVELLDEVEDDGVDRTWLVLYMDLRERLQSLDERRDQRGILGLHFGEERAWRVLDTHRDELDFLTEP
ncbi:MAG: DUF4173 domain-containing protein [Anaerolineae bacterium]|nr:DUF4173 domain-containing protein [Anaerolineae bacterium]